MRKLFSLVSVSALGVLASTVATPAAPAAAGVRDGCEANYIGACVPPLPPDLDCSDIRAPLRVIGTDWHKLDSDGDGTACEQFGTPPPPDDQENPPGNAAAARRQITKVFEDFAKLSTPEDMAANLDLVSDPRGLVEAAGQAAANFPYEVSHDRNVVRDIHFISPTEARVTYDILIDRGPNFTNRVGFAVFADGGWRMSRDTACGNLGLAGGNCDGPPPTSTPGVKTVFMTQRRQRL
jgi:hypothetical protein